MQPDAAGAAVNLGATFWCYLLPRAGAFTTVASSAAGADVRQHVIHRFGFDVFMSLVKRRFQQGLYKRKISFYNLHLLVVVTTKATAVSTKTPSIIAVFFIVVISLCLIQSPGEFLFAATPKFDTPLQNRVNIVRNGTFEDPDVSRITFDTYNAGQTFGDWMVEAGSIDHISEFYWQAAEGRQSIDLSGTYTNTPGIIYQDLATSQGTLYDISLSISGNPEGGAAIKRAELWWGEVLIDTLEFNVSGRSNWSMGWIRQEYQVAAGNNTTRLRLKSLDPGYHGIVVDAVSVTPVLANRPSLDLPIDYTDRKFAEVAASNSSPKPGRINSWLDHTFPNYSEDLRVTIWSGAVYTATTSLYLSAVSCLSVGRDACYNGHNAIDFQKARIDEPIYPAAAGSVAELHNTYPSAGPRGRAYGNYILIDHGDGYATFYAHLKSINPILRVGTVITSTRPITVGLIGGTGGHPVHLHFGVYYDKDKDGLWEETYRGPTEAVDPFGWMGIGNDPAPTASLYLWKYPLHEEQPVGAQGATLATPSGTGKFVVPSTALSTTLNVRVQDLPLPGPLPFPFKQSSQAVGVQILPSLQDNFAFSSEVSALTKPAIININYDKNAEAHLDLGTLQISTWEATTSSWTTLPTSIDTARREATAETLAPGIFVLQASLKCVNDNLEPNDGYENASTTSNALVKQAFDGTLDEDWYAFAANGGESYRTTVNGTKQSVQPLLEVFDQDGITRIAIASNVNSEASAEWRAKADGVYFIRVYRSPNSSTGCTSEYTINTTFSGTNFYLPLVRK